jgi:hypothetical protein
MPWYNENFDSDLEKELDERKITNDGKFLDLRLQVHCPTLPSLLLHLVLLVSP